MFGLSEEKAWYKILRNAHQLSGLKRIHNILNQKVKQGVIIYPSQNDILKALELCDFNDVKVVIIGQDPYHGTGEANGLAFSVNDGVKTTEKRVLKRRVCHTVPHLLVTDGRIVHGAPTPLKHGRAGTGVVVV